MRLSTLLLAASFGGFTSAAPSKEPAELAERSIEKRACFKKGRSFGPYKDLALNSAEFWCKSYYEGDYKKGKVYPKKDTLALANKPKLCIEFKIGLTGPNAPATKRLKWQECLSGFESEIRSCGKGGQTTYGNWYYRVDPNDC
ncbi:hypothetical protein NLU13_3795 [Sarocladium strictum]|uniref:Uncharacterized protein n=1 Tax=Sarocladium strictum TaxID=5046 RepID=A0AA39GJD9_SARSR|nr:hypothetical protein NLU13_3795 [Sarocladium strictum]